MSTSKQELLFLIGKRLREERERINKSQEEIAKNFSLSTRTWGKYERGETVPDASILSVLAEEYDFDINYILTGEQVAPNDITMEELNLIKNYRAMDESARLNIQAVGASFAKSEPIKKTSAKK